jgi:multiple antibiotic resistance protein
MNYTNILTVTITLFAVIDMLGNIPLVIKLRKDHGEINSVKSSYISAGIMILSLFVGDTLFSFLGIEVSHFAIAGSLLLMYFGTKMVLGLEESNTKKKKANGATVFPLAFPLIAGPGTLSTIMSFKAEFSNLEIIIGILLNGIIIFAVLKLADKLRTLLGTNGLDLMERFFGIILISIAIKMFLTNLVLSLNLC